MVVVDYELGLCATNAAGREVGLGEAPMAQVRCPRIPLPMAAGDVTGSTSRIAARPACRMPTEHSERVAVELLKRLLN